MVEIRTLQPSVRIALPQKRRYRLPSNVKRDTVIRRLRDNPPPTPQPTPCRLWQGALDGNGYGKRKMRKADDSGWEYRAMHRWVVEQVLGRRLRKDEVIMHACDQPLCYRYEHLSVGTMASNNADARRKGRASKPPVNRLRGAANGNTKIPPSMYPLVIKRYIEGEYRATIARSFGVHVQTIDRILKVAEWPEMDTLPPHIRPRSERSRSERTPPVNTEDDS